MVTYRRRFLRDERPPNCDKTNGLKLGNLHSTDGSECGGAGLNGAGQRACPPLYDFRLPVRFDCLR
jgi:hypothetical protein